MGSIAAAAGCPEDCEDAEELGEEADDDDPGGGHAHGCTHVYRTWFACTAH